MNRLLITLKTVPYGNLIPCDHKARQHGIGSHLWHRSPIIPSSIPRSSRASRCQMLPDSAGHKNKKAHVNMGLSVISCRLLPAVT